MDYTEKLPKPAKTGVNQGLTSPSSSFMRGLLGDPRDTYSGECQDPTNPAFKKLVTTRTSGPIKVTGLKAALNSLDAVFSDVQSEMPDLYALLGTAGMMCCRYKKITGKVIADPSNHTWGAAVDLTIDGKLDTQGDNTVMRGLLILAKYFNAHGWYWGAVFPTEDAMHFEVARETLLKWRNAGAL